MEKKPLVETISLRNTYLATASAFLFIAVMGMLSAYPSPATVDMKNPGSRFMDITPDQITWIASIGKFAGAFSPFLSGYASHRLGRKAVLIFISSAFVSSWLMVAYAPTLAYVYAGRLISGFCAGVCCVAAPAYVVEIAPAAIRGRLSSGFQVAFTIGVLIVMSLGIFLRWSWLAISGATITALAACMMVFMPESPVWLVKNCRSMEALEGLKFLKGSDGWKELQKIIDDQSSQQVEGLKFKELLDPALYKPLILSVSLMFFQQFSGINPLMSYTEDIFEQAGSTIRSDIAAVVVALVQVVGTLLSSGLMDRSGRRCLLMVSSFCMALSLGVLGLYSYLVSRSIILNTVYGWIPLVSFVVYIFTFSLGMGPVPFVMTPELVTIRTRSTVLAIANFFCSLFAFVITKVFEDMRSTMGDQGVFWTYSAVSAAGMIFCYFCLPETKGLTISQIHRQFSLTPQEKNMDNIANYRDAKSINKDQLLN